MGFSNQWYFSPSLHKGIHKISIVLLTTLYLTSIINVAKSQDLNSVSDSIRTELSAEELREFRKKRLSIVVKVAGEEEINITTNTTSTSIYNQTYTDENTQVTRSLDKNKTWSVYRGFDTISETELYRIAGYQELHKKSKEYYEPEKREYEEFTDAETALRATALIGGVFTAAAMLSKKPKVRKAGAIGTGAAAGLYLIGIAIPQKKETYTDYPEGKMLPASQVKGIAEDYNLQLLKKLNKSSSSN